MSFGLPLARSGVCLVIFEVSDSWLMRLIEGGLVMSKGVCEEATVAELEESNALGLSEVVGIVAGREEDS